VVAVQPGVETLECLEVGTGRLLWRHAEQRPRRLLGRSGDRVIVETDDGIVALALADGQVAWRHHEPLGVETGRHPQGIERRCTAAAAGEKYVLYSVRSGPVDKPKTPALVWLDAATGRQLGSVEVPQWQDVDPRIGPLIPAGGRLWTFFGKEKDPKRDVVELTPGAVVTAVDEAVVGPWQQGLSPALVQTVHDVAPQWQLVSGYGRAGAEQKGAWQGENDAALILARPGVPAVVVTELKLPPGKSPKLNLRLGHEAGAIGQFTLRVAGETLLSQEWKADNANRWDALNLHLGKFAGQQVVISLDYRASDGKDHAWWLKTAEVVVE
jgi:hypothetical protein